MELRNVKVIPLSPDAYKRKEMENEGKITGIFWVKPDDLNWRVCYQITYPDGFTDYTPVSEFDKGGGVTFSTVMPEW